MAEQHDPLIANALPGRFSTGADDLSRADCQGTRLRLNMLRWLPHLLSMLLCSVASADGFAVRLPQRSPCAAEQIIGALSARLRRSAMRVNGGEVRLSLTLSEGHWAIEILAPGQPPLSRPLAVPEGDCLALSEASALITERYLASINWISAPGQVRPLPPPPRWQASLALNGGAAVGPTGVTPMARLDLGARYTGWALEASFAYLSWGQVDLTSTAYQFYRNAAVALPVSRHFELGPGALVAGLAPGLELYWVGSNTTSSTTPNPLPHRQLVFVSQPFLEVQAGYDFGLPDGFTLGLRVQVRAHPGTVTFVTEGYTSHVVTPLVSGNLSLVVGALVF